MYTHTQICIYINIYIYVCKCICIYADKYTDMYTYTNCLSRYLLSRRRCTYKSITIFIFVSGSVHVYVSKWMVYKYVYRICIYTRPYPLYLHICHRYIHIPTSNIFISMYVYIYTHPQPLPPPPRLPPVHMQIRKKQM